MHLKYLWTLQHLVASDAKFDMSKYSSLFLAETGRQRGKCEEGINNSSEEVKPNSEPFSRIPLNLVTVRCFLLP